MLARVNRVVRADDFRQTVRRGRRVSTPHAVIYVSARGVDDPTRFGFIVSKAVGNSVARNLMTRRLRSIGHDLLEREATGKDIVIRALPGSPEAKWSTLQGEIFDGLERNASKR